MNKTLIIILILLSFAGVIDTAYLSSNHYSGELPAGCTIGGGGIGSCDVVLTSEYSVVAGIPLVLLGLFYYFTLFVLATTLISIHNKKILQALAVISGVGVLASLLLVYIQLFVLNAICIYCMTSAAITTTFFVVAVVMLSRKN